MSKKIEFMLDGGRDVLKLELKADTDIADVREALKAKCAPKLDQFAAIDLKLYLTTDGNVAPNQPEMNPADPHSIITDKSIVVIQHPSYKTEDSPPSPHGKGSYLDRLDRFVKSTPFDGCSSSDTWFIPQNEDVVGSIQKQLSCKSDPGARILISAPPASGKTSLLQTIIRAELAKETPSFYPVLANAGKTRYRDQMLVDKEQIVSWLIDAIDKAQDAFPDLPIVLIVDDGQCVFPILDNLVKTERGFHLLVAASYYQPPSLDPSTPACFQNRIDAESLALSPSHAELMYSILLNEFEQKLDPEQTQIMEFFKQNSLLTFASSEKYHLGLYRFLLQDFLQTCQLEKKQPSLRIAMKMISSPALTEKTWFNRVFAVLKESSGLRQNTRAKECVYDLLWSTDFSQEKYATEISMLVKCAILQRPNPASLVPTTPLVRRLLFKIADPYSQTQGEYRFRSIDALIHDVIGCIAWRDVKKMTDAKVLEYHWAMMFYQRLAGLVGGQSINVERQAKGSSRMDLFLPVYGVALEYTATVELSVLNEHHARFDPAPNTPHKKYKSAAQYLVQDVKEYRVINFKAPLVGASSEDLEHYALKEHEALSKDKYQQNHVTIVPIDDGTHAVWIGHTPQRVNIPHAALQDILMRNINAR